ncbi:MAG: thiamine phosphate synthase, partial [Dehalococcoidia bacterium]|nr:thiamine phosphate synthase [Dehalococcoidia bacterium]
MIASIQAAIDGGVNMVQIRQKDANYEELINFTNMVLKLVKNTTLIMVNSETPINIHGIAGTHFPEKTDSKTLYSWPQ